MTGTTLDLEAGRKLFAGACDFMLGVADLTQLPASDLPEIAFAGRSNVGKSSLLNALTGRKALAKTSGTPGRTQQLNVFNLGGKLYMVDMPGYGYAKVSRSQVKAWTALIRDYLRGRPNLRCVLVLVDARHGLKDSDAQIMDLLDQAAVMYRIVLTKADKVKDQALSLIIHETRTAIAKRPAAHPEICVTSAQDKNGIEELRAVIHDFLAP